MVRLSSVMSRRGFLHVITDAGAHFDHGLVHLRLDVFLEKSSAFLDDFELDVRTEVERVRIYGLVLFFNPDGEAGTHWPLRFHDNIPGNFRGIDDRR